MLGICRLVCQRRHPSPGLCALGGRPGGEGPSRPRGSRGPAVNGRASWTTWLREAPSGSLPQPRCPLLRTALSARRSPRAATRAGSGAPLHLLKVSIRVNDPELSAQGSRLAGWPSQHGRVVPLPRRVPVPHRAAMARGCALAVTPLRPSRGPPGGAVCALRHKGLASVCAPVPAIWWLWLPAPSAPASSGSSWLCGFSRALRCGLAGLRSPGQVLCEVPFDWHLSDV